MAETDILNAISEATSYQYEGYSYTGEYAVDGGTVSVRYDVSVLANILTEYTKVMNDFARYMGALYRVADTVKGVSFEGTAYTWDEKGTLKGSNWVDADGNTLVSSMKSYILANFGGDGATTFDVPLTLTDGADASVGMVYRAVFGDGEGTVQTIDTVNAMLEGGQDVTFLNDIEGTVRVRNGTTIDGAGFALRGGIVLDAESSEDVYDVTIKGMTIEGTGQYGIIGQNQTAGAVRPVRLTLEGVTVNGCARNAVYVTNAKAFVMTSCTVGTEGTAMTGYGVDLNLCGVEDATISIVGNTFGQACADVGAVKVSQRGGVGLTDDVNDDILNTVSATISSCEIRDNDFSAMDREVDPAVSKAVAYEYPEYTYYGNLVANGTIVTAMYDATASELMDHMEDVVFDFDYLLGALYYASDAKGITWNGKSYVWEGDRTASNWVCDGGNLSSDVASWVLANIASLTSTSIKMTVAFDGSEMEFTYSIGIGTVPAFADVFIGSSANADGSCRTYTQAFPFTVESKGDTDVNIRGTSEGDMTFGIPDGGWISSASTEGDGHYDIVITTSGDVSFTGVLRDGATVDEEAQPSEEQTAESINESFSLGYDVILLNDIVGSIVVPEGVEVTLDLDGHSIVPTDGPAITVYGTLTVEDEGTVYSSEDASALQVEPRGVCTVSGGTWDASAGWYAFKVMGRLTLNGGDVIGGVTCSAIACGFDMDSESDAERYHALGDSSYIAQLVVNDVTVESEYIGIKCDEHGRVMIFGGVITADTQAVLNWNQTVIEGGTFESTSTATVISNGSYNGSDGNLVIGGGTFIASTEGDIIMGLEGYTEGTRYTIFGGTYKPNAPGAEYIADGYEVTVDADGNISIARSDWTFPEGGSQGGGLNGYKRLLMHKDVLNYVSGGIEPPLGFRIKAVISASAKGGVTAYLESSTGKVILYQNGSEVTGSLDDVTLLLVGTN